MKVLLTATSYPASETDWKSLFIRRMVEGLAAAPGIDLHLWAPPGPAPEGVQPALLGDDADWLSRLMDAGGVAHVLRQKPVRGFLLGAGLVKRQARAIARLQPEVLHLNWLQSALAVPASIRAPQLVTALGSDMRLLRLPLIARLLRRAFQRRPTVLCPNAAWMVSPLESQFGDVARVEQVPFGIAEQWFMIRRDALPARPRWLVVSRITRAKLGPLLEWSAPLFSTGQRELHVIGPMQETLSFPDWVHYHGPATPTQLAQDWFGNAHGLISLSTHDEGLPQVMLEAMAAGLPIVASPLPAHRELLEAAQPEQLCDAPETYRAAVARLEDHAVNLASGAQARRWAKATYGTWADCAERFHDRYKRLLSEPR